MLCTDCNERTATVHLTQIVNGEKVEMHLCFQCANRRGVQVWVLPMYPQVQVPPKTVPPQAPVTAGVDNRACKDCGYPWRDFVNTGFLGCTRCYSSFADLLSQVIAKNYGNAKHQGKIPVRGAGPLKIRREIASLRSALEKAIQQEDFERAAELRDQIRSLEQQV